MRNRRPQSAIQPLNFLAILVTFNSLSAAERPPIIEQVKWVRKQPLTLLAANGQYRPNSAIRFITIHFTHTETGDGTQPSEEEILNSKVHSNGLYQWERAEDEKTKIDTYYIATGADDKPLPNFGGTPYQYLIGNSGVIYKGRPDATAPASNTYYYSEAILTRATYDFNGSVRISAADERAILDARAEAFENWKKGLGNAAYDQWVRQEKAILRKAGLPESGPKFEARLLKQGARLVGPGSTAGHITVSFIGSYQRPSDHALDSAVKLIAHLMSASKFPEAKIKTHREIASTSCPGAELQMWVRHRNGENGALFDRLSALRR